MHYKYKKIVTNGANGTTIRHNTTDVVVLGLINSETYIYTKELKEQPAELVFEEVVLTQELLSELKKQNYINSQKNTARSKIRNIKDIEDDLVDQKQLIQFLSRGLASLWKTLPTEIKEANPYAANFELFSDEILSVDVRLDLEADQIAKIMSILKDEEEFAKIVQDEYLGKINAKV